MNGRSTAVDMAPLWLLLVIVASLIPGMFIFRRIGSTGKWNLLLVAAFVAMPITGSLHTPIPFLIAVTAWLAVEAVGLAMVLQAPAREGRHRPK